MALLPLAYVGIDTISRLLVVPPAVDDVILRAEGRHHGSDPRRLLGGGAVPGQVHILVENGGKTLVGGAMPRDMAAVAGHLTQYAVEGIPRADRHGDGAVALPRAQMFAPPAKGQAGTSQPQVQLTGSVGQLVVPAVVALDLEHEEAASVLQDALGQGLLGGPGAHVLPADTALAGRHPRQHPQIIQALPHRLALPVVALVEYGQVSVLVPCRGPAHLHQHQRGYFLQSDLLLSDVCHLGKDRNGVGIGIPAKHRPDLHHGRPLNDLQCIPLHAVRDVDQPRPLGGGDHCGPLMGVLVLAADRDLSKASVYGVVAEGLQTHAVVFDLKAKGEKCNGSAHGSSFPGASRWALFCYIIAQTRRDYKREMTIRKKAAAGAMPFGWTSPPGEPFRFFNLMVLLSAAGLLFLEALDKSPRS